MKQTFLKKILARFNIAFGNEFQFNYVQPLYPYAVIYTDGTYAWGPIKDKTVWGVIFGTGIIHLKAVDERMGWNEAQKYCKWVTFGRRRCSCGSRIFWSGIEDYVRWRSERKLVELNDFIKSLGGNPLQGFVWSSYYNLDGKGKIVKISSENDVNNYQSEITNSSKFGVRLICPFREIPSPKRYPFAVLFTDGTSSWYPQSNKQIWGVVPVYGTAIRLCEAETTMNWEEAQEYCNDIKIADYSCSCGDRSSWNTVICLNTQILNPFLVFLGGNPLKHYLWTSEYFRSGEAFFTWDVESSVFLVSDDAHLFNVRPMCIYA